MIAALILAHLTAIVRRWLVFFGLARPLPGEDADTIYGRVAGWLRRVWVERPRLRQAAIAALVLELSLGSAWIGVAHGQHLYRLGDQAIGALRGEQVRYVGLCDRSGRNHTVRIAIDRDGTVTTREI